MGDAPGGELVVGRPHRQRHVRRTVGTSEQPGDRAHPAAGRRHVVAVTVAQDVHRRPQPIGRPDDERRPLGHPGIDDVLAVIALERPSNERPAEPPPGDGGAEVQIDQVAQGGEVFGGVRHRPARA
jgi:hypothetical protein